MCGETSEDLCDDQLIADRSIVLHAFTNKQQATDCLLQSLLFSEVRESSVTNQFDLFKVLKCAPVLGKILLCHDKPKGS